MEVQLSLFISGTCQTSNSCHVTSNTLPTSHQLPFLCLILPKLLSQWHSTALDDQFLFDIADKLIARVVRYTPCMVA